MSLRAGTEQGSIRWGKNPYLIGQLMSLTPLRHLLGSIEDNLEHN